jgi:signal transduction histidine kinase/CheY-like chemotaxis protein
MDLRRAWSDLSLSKKLYAVIGIMGLLIATELLTLLFAMNTLSSVRAFVGGEGLWSKAQKDAVLNLQRYAESRDPKYYDGFLHCLEIPQGDRQARTEMQKSKPDRQVITQGFLRGGIHADDIPGLIQLVLKFHSIPHLARALAIWSQGDELMIELVSDGEELHRLVQSRASYKKLFVALKKVDALNDRLTIVENNFSRTLGEGSRWLEHLLMGLLLAAVFTVESTGVLLTLSFSRNLTRGLRELYDVATKVGRGIFNQKIQVRSRDELGQLAEALNKMTTDLENSIGKREIAENANRVKSLFLANMSHEIRTPLGAILGFADLLKDPGISDEERSQYSGIIHRTASHLTQVINDILDLSKVEAGYVEIEKTCFSLQAMLDEIHSVLSVRCTEKAVKLIFSGRGNEIPKLIYSDGNRLRQILMNILGNAIKFTDRGEVSLTYEVIEKDLIFTVRDTGIGISPEQAAQLFQSFRQVDSSSTRRHEGTGLGLVLSRRLARLLGGEVTLLPGALGTGSTFVVKVAFEERPSYSETKALSFAEDPSMALSGKNILLVDDVSENRILIERILVKRGARVQTAVNGVDGIEKALGDNFDLILMDIQMPVMDGYTATQMLREHGYQKPIIALTAHAMKEDRAKCLEVGCNDYLTKPIHVSTLVETLAKY